jgi:hypothetical protein
MGFPVYFIENKQEINIGMPLWCGFVFSQASEFFARQYGERPLIVSSPTPKKTGF